MESVKPEDKISEYNGEFLKHSENNVFNKRKPERKCLPKPKYFTEFLKYKKSSDSPFAWTDDYY